MAKQQAQQQKPEAGPNFRVMFEEQAARIVRTAAPVDRIDVHPTLAHARVELKHRARLHAENTVLAAKMACEVKEKDLPVEKPEAERGEDRPR